MIEYKLLSTITVTPCCEWIWVTFNCDNGALLWMNMSYSQLWQWRVVGKKYELLSAVTVALCCEWIWITFNCNSGALLWMVYALLSTVTMASSSVVNQYELISTVTVAFNCELIWVIFNYNSGVLFWMNMSYFVLSQWCGFANEYELLSI